MLEPRRRSPNVIYVGDVLTIAPVALQLPEPMFFCQVMN